MNVEWEVYGKTDCFWCEKALDKLDKIGASYAVKIINSDNKKEILTELTKRIGFTPKTVLQIFRNGKHVGGYEEAFWQLDGVEGYLV